MMCRKKPFKIGDWITVKHCWGGYQLPDGLPEGANVKVLSLEAGWAGVEFSGTQFRVFIACAESGWEYWLRGKWHAENDPIMLKPPS